MISIVTAQQCFVINKLTLWQEYNIFMVYLLLVLLILLERAYILILTHNYLLRKRIYGKIE